MKRIEWLDRAKGIGILLVILGHVILQDSSSSNTELNLVSIIYSFHMPLFFILSGILASYIRTERNWKGIARHLLLPYLKWSFIYLLIISIRNPTGLKSIAERIYATFSGRGMAPLWFLVSLALAELVYYKLLKFPKLNGGGYSLLISIAFFIALTPIYEQIQSLNIILQYPITAIFRVLPSYIFFALGALLSEMYMSISRMPLLKKGLLGCAAAFVTIALNLIFDVEINMHLMMISNPIIFLITGMLGSTFIIIFSMIVSKDEILGRIGKKSLDLMALHYPPIPIIKASSIICVCLLGRESNFIVFLFTLLCLWFAEICYEFLLKIIRDRGWMV